MTVRIKWKNVVLAIFIEFFLILSIISITKVIKWYIDSKNTETQISNITEKSEVIETEDNESTEVINNGQIIESDPYWDYIKLNLIDVDFTELKKINNDVVGWIQVKNTNVNYPFVQTSDNEYYLSHTFNKNYNSAGWVFLDYRNSIESDDNNFIIYAHGRLDNTMFGSLRNILTNGWLNNVENHVIKISTESENTLWQLFSVYRIPTTNDYIKTNFSSDTEYSEFLELITGRSAYNFNTVVDVKDRILTLSTCYDDNDKVVLHAKLIKRNKKA